MDQLLTDTSVKYRLTIGEVSAKCRRSIGEVSVNVKLYRPRHIWNYYRSCLDRMSTDYRPPYRPTVTEYRPTVDRVSTDYRPIVERYIDRYNDGYLSRHYPQYTRSDSQTVTFFLKVLSIHLNLQFQLRSVREVCKDLNIMSLHLSADRVKYEPELIKGSYEQTRDCIW